MRTIKWLVSGLFLFLLSWPVQAQTDMISAEAFIARVKENPNLVIIDANKAKSFASSHVKNAIYVNHTDLYQEGDIDGLIAAPEKLAAFFGQLGIQPNSEIVIYDDGTQKYATRIYWILKYLGAENVAMLHRDLDAWRKVRIPLSTEVIKPKPAVFTPALQPAWFASMEDVITAKDNPMAVVVDARTPDEFMGKTDDSQGHIPGAVNLDFNALETATGAFLPVEELQKLAEAQGITPDKEVIVYCKTGVRGAVVFVALKNMLGYPNVKLYDGSYNEWVAKHPVVQ